ncbi:hypothetical protein pETSU_251 [Edwardsiella phage pEt-SU]|uniref:Uncharacterized protein n=1 Tax=Edwardsiella phage pEt-SU TaxID=2562142 RepID=A0A4D6DX22_9CAUD|nr:hypothetical protein HOV39_gp271 [Edwardsiella phage pEt-SU]QBZ70832.1 hypothetical protein pETSU_251 [Edwardsiella phage pEt-SU]
MKMVELLVGYDMEKLYSGEVSPVSTDMITDIHIKSDDELTPSERRQFETELSDLIHKHFVTNKRRLEQELLKRQYNVKELRIFYTDYMEYREDDFYHCLARGSENFLAKLKSGEVEKLSRSFILATGILSEHTLDQFDRFAKSVQSKISVQEESVSTEAIRTCLNNMVGLTEPECLVLFGRFGTIGMSGAFVHHYNRLVPLAEIEYAFRDLNFPQDVLIAAMIKYTKDHPIKE